MRTSQNAVTAKFAEIVKSEVQLPRIPLPRTPVNRASPEMRQASLAGNISVVLRPSLKRKRRMGKEKKNVSAAEENKAIFRRYAEEVGNQHNFEIVDEIFERYISHQPDGSTLVRGPEDVKRFQGEYH